jgi:hypothetical protein
LFKWLYTRKPVAVSFIDMETNNQDKKGAVMIIRIKADAWMYYSIVILAFISLASAIAAIVLTWMHQPVPGVLILMGFLAAGSLVRLLISPLNSEMLE